MILSGRQKREKYFQKKRSFFQEAEIEVTDDEVGNALTEIIAELKAKYGDQWSKHIGEIAEAEELVE